jgi:adenylate kinase family enzyme
MSRNKDMDTHGFCKTERLAISPKKILLVGTLGSGKTTIADCLARDTGFPYASIDDCRIRYGDGTFSGEDSAWDHFLESCSRSTPAILEFSGMGPHTREVRDSLLRSTIPVAVIWLMLPQGTCIARAAKRQNKIPFPYPLAPVEYAVPAIHDAIEDAWETIWSREPGFHATRQDFLSTTSVAGMYSAIREICSAL